MERTVAYTRPSLAADSNSIVDDFYMSEAQFSSPRERQRTEQHPLSSPPPSDRQKKLRHHSHGYIDITVFWDSLSKIWLTKHALRELGRRNAKPLPHSSPRRAHQPLTRNSLAEAKKRKPTQSVGNFLYDCTPKILKDIKLFARHGGPDLSDLRGHPKPARLLEHTTSLRDSSCPSGVQKRDSLSRTKTTTMKTKTTIPKDANYRQKLVDSGIYPLEHVFPDGCRPQLPPEWKEIKRRLSQPQPSLSSRFSEEEVQEFIEDDTLAFNEDAVKDSVLPTLLRATGAFRGAQKNIIFTNLDPIAAGISQVKPDYYYGAQPEQIDLEIRNNEQLNKHIIPSSHTHLPAVPNFFLEAKGPAGSIPEAIRQACYYGALGARAIHSLRTYGQDPPVYDNSIRTISSIYHFGTLKLYGHSVAQPNGPGTQPEYYMYQLGSWSVTGDWDFFLKGATALKNAIDLTREYRDDAIGCANEICRGIGYDENIDDEEGGR